MKDSTAQSNGTGMAWRPHPKGATVDPENPRAWGTDDRTGFISNLKDLSWQMEWAGTTLRNTHLLVRQQSLDIPSPWFKTILLPPDPPPIFNARPEPYTIDETDWRVIQDDSTIRVTEGVPVTDRVTEGGILVTSVFANTNLYTADTTLVTADR